MILKNKTNLLVVLFFVSSIVMVFGQQVSPEMAPADQQMTDFSLSGFGEKGKKSWELSGKSADIMTNTVKLKDVVGNLYGEQEQIKLTADKGDYNKSDGKVHLEENVLISTSSGAKLATNSLNWDRKNQVVATSDPVNIERDNMIAYALGAVGHPSLNKVSLEKDVQVNFTPPADNSKSKELGKNKITITCDGPLEIDYQKSVAIFNKKVKVETNDALIYSDVMEVYFTKSEKDKEKANNADGSGLNGVMGSSMDRIRAYGNVAIVRGENISRSEEAIYTAKDNKITLSGQPKLVIYSSSDMSSVFQSK